MTTERLQPDVEEGLETMDGKLHRTKGRVINQPVRECIQRQEHHQARWHETLEAMESVVQGKVVSGDVVHAWLRSWGRTDELPSPKVDG